MIESINDDVSPDKSVNTTAILSIAGWGMLLGAVACAYIAQAPHTGLSPLQSMISVCLGWTMFVLMHVLSIQKFTNNLLGSPHHWRLLVTTAIGFTPMPLLAAAELAGASIPFAICALGWMLFGCSSGLAMLSWGTAWSSVAARQSGDSSYVIARQTTWALAVAALACLLTLLAPPYAALVFILTLSFCSLVLLRACHKRLTAVREFESAGSSRPGDGAAGELDEAEEAMADEAGALGTTGDECGSAEAPAPRVSQPEEEPRTTPDRLLTRSILTPLTRGLSFGVVFFFIAFAYPHPQPLALTSIAMAAASVIILVILSKLKRVPSVPSVERATFPILAATLLLAMVANDTITCILMTAATTAVLYQFILNSDAVSLRDKGIGAILHCSRKNFVAISGVGIGLIIQTSLAAAGTSIDEALFLLSLLLLFLMVLEPAFIPYMSYVAVEQLASHFNDSQSEHTSVSDKTPAQTPSQTDTAPREAPWKDRCAAVCQQYGLSPRESEVFVLLAKGRNAEHVSNELYISPHTARSHMYRIYRKLDINSQQELIDLVEEFPR